MWIVIEGNIYEGFKFYGPFNTHDLATAFGDNLQGYNIIMELVNPVVQEIANA